MIEQQIEQDLKAALLAHDAVKVSTLRGLKSVLLNVKVAEGKRDSGLEDNEVISLLAKEAKKRQESAELYRQGGDESRAQAELDEKEIIAAYLPVQLNDEEVAEIVETTIAELGVSGPQAMGQVIGAVRGKTNGQADGALIARLVKEKLQ